MGQITGYTGTFENKHISNELIGNKVKSKLEFAKKTIITVDRNMKVNIKKAYSDDQKLKLKHAYATGNDNVKFEVIEE